MLTPDQARDRVHDAIARATRAGADAADAMLSAGESLSVSEMNVHHVHWWIIDRRAGGVC